MKVALKHWFWPDSPVTRAEWQLLALVGTAFLICRYDHALLNLAIPDMQAEFGVAENELGPFVAFARLGAIAAIPLALLADRHGRRSMLLATIIGFTVCSVATAFAPNWQTFAALQFAARAFTAADEILSVVVVLEEFAVRRRGWAVGMLAAMGALGEGLSAALYPLSAILPGGWRGLYALAALPLVALTILRTRLRETPHFEAVKRLEGLGLRQLGSAIAATPGRFAALLVVAAAYNFPLSAVFSFMPKYLRETHGYGAGEVSLFVIGTGFFALAGNLVGGALTDRIGRRTGFAAFCVLGLIAFAAFYSAPTQLLPLFWAAGLFSYLASHAVFLALAGEVFPTVSRTAISTVALAAGSLAGAFGLVLEARLFDVAGAHNLAILLMLPTLAIAAMTAFKSLPDYHGRPLDDKVRSI